jgi:predicted HAD superfamily Cof-like phosphohydrolase
MRAEQRMVEHFHRTFDGPYGGKPGFPSEDTQTLRYDLIKEELLELGDAMDDVDLVGIADALADLLYVVYGTACSFGLDMQEIFDEVHRSNMSKVGGHKRGDGKWIKPSTYSPPNLEPIIKKQKMGG